MTRQDLLEKIVRAKSVSEAREVADNISAEVVTTAQKYWWAIAIGIAAVSWGLGRFKVPF